ncbi:sodium:alanine symporter family protein [candidate division KSB1 bacterium]|nr:sodium:alanine symporter family protein [candidate division KSB1 bacterium]
MTETLSNLFGTLSSWIWGLPLILILIGTGAWFTIRLHGLQFTKLFHALNIALIKRHSDDTEEGDVSHFQALMTALSATVGTGNIAGVATAIAAGGPGALFWMWITGLVGMATKYAEAVLAVRFRIKDHNGNMSGGPMYYISKGMGWKWMGTLFAVFASIAAFGIGNMVQSNSVADVVESAANIPTWVTGLVLMVGTGLVILGGIKSIGRVTGILVPVMIFFYVGTALLILILKYAEIPNALSLVFKHAFTPTAGFGGFVGSTVMLTIRHGVSKGIFSNESGLGSSPIAAAAARTKYPAVQALVSMTQTFIDTLIVCTLTGLVLIVTGAWQSGLTGAELTSTAFSDGVGSQFGQIIVAVGLALFAFSTLIGWSYYGEKSIEFLIGERAILPYRVVWTLVVGLGAVIKLDLVWAFADVCNGLMAFPNLIALIALTPIVVQETQRYLSRKIE